jgi:hypothetical protein
MFTGIALPSYAARCVVWAIRGNSRTVILAPDRIPHLSVHPLFASAFRQRADVRCWRTCASLDSSGWRRIARSRLRASRAAVRQRDWEGTSLANDVASPNDYAFLAGGGEMARSSARTTGPPPRFARSMLGRRASGPPLPSCCGRPCRWCCSGERTGIMLYNGAYSVFAGGRHRNCSALRA